MIISSCFGQNETVPLWPVNIPNRQPSDEKETRRNEDIFWIGNVQEPNLAIYLPAKRHANGMAVVICPGGGYNGLAYDWEGTDVAKWLNSKGIAGFVLKYRLPKSKSLIVGNEAPLQDAQRALRLVRANAKKWNINPDKIGIMGFSAGGHLASTLGTHFNSENSFKPDSIDLLSARPDFMALIYPVITFQEPYLHRGSRNALIGETATRELTAYYSNELQVTKDTPPTFLVHSTDDGGVPVENTLLFYQALKKENIYSEMHIYPKGGHGYSLALGQGRLQTWPDRLYEWLLSLE